MLLALLVTVLLNALMFAVIYTVTTRRIRKELSGSRVLEAIRDEIQSLIVELNQTTDRNVSIAEERMRQLRELIAEADKKIQLVSRETEKHQVGVDVYNRLKDKSLRSPPAGSVSSDSTDREPTPEERDREGRETSRSPGEEPLADRVVRLSRQGFDARMIAQQLGAGLGEVELILSLRSGRGK